MWLTELAEYADRIVHLGPDDGRNHGQLCWDVLAPTGLLAPHCGHCKHGHGGPRNPQEMETALRLRIPPNELTPWIAATLTRELVHPSPDGPMRLVADAIANGLIALLGPEADWRANGYAAYREGASGTSAGWGPVTEATFDAAVVGKGNGHAVVVVATGED
ncbi:hypothetical protein [Streptomyces sp. NPDC048248]|uniref:hypothetical protein n=1 Tax=Streptomyces sp. NPDC048248 TaxID=3365523 RepID=UPI00371126B4